VLYLVLKAFHVTALTVWMAGMIVVPLLLTRPPAPGRERDPTTLAALRGFATRVTSPAMLATLGLGLWLAQDAGWFRASWLQLKLVLVLILTGLHGVVAGQSRRLVAEPGMPASALLRAVPWLTLACLAGIALLAIVKPGLW
jgi:uncharacterized membrane protein